MQRCGAIALAGMFLVSTVAWASGPADRKLTDPAKVTSLNRTGTGAVEVAALLDTHQTGAFGLSRDGKMAVFTSDSSGRPNLWTMRTDGTEAHQLTHSNDRQVGPLFTPDGKNILFAQDQGGGEYFDLFEVSVAGGEPRNLTHTDDISETGFLFSPGGSQIAFSRKAKASASRDLAVMSWPAADQVLLTHETDPKASWGAFAWSADGKYIYANRSAGLEDSDVFRVSVSDGSVENLTKHDGKELISASDLAPDGKTLLITSNRKGGYENVGLLDLATRQIRWVTDTQWSASGEKFSPDGHAFTYTLNADGRVTLYFVDVQTLQTSTRGVPDGLNFGAGQPSSYLGDGSYILSHQDSTHPGEIYSLKPTGKLEQLTHDESPAFAKAVLPTSQLITYKSFDGQMISALLWVPFQIKRDGTAPAVVLPHGGPTGQTVDYFNDAAVLLVSRGFVVIAPNVRGSTGYGMAFQKANTKDLGGGDLKDEIAGVDFLKSTGFIDSRRVGIWGGSYGGFMTLMAIGKTPSLWAAAVDEYGILDWMTMLQHEDPYLQEYEKQLLGDPVKDRAIYEASSPLKYIRNATAPLLVLQGDRDIRVPREEAEQVVNILKGEGRTVDVVFYPQEGHGFAKREHRQDELQRSVDWLSKYLKPRAVPATSTLTKGM